MSIQTVTPLIPVNVAGAQAKQMRVVDWSKYQAPPERKFAEALLQRVLVAGDCGTGKSRFLLSLPSTAIFDWEGTMEGYTPVHKSSRIFPVWKYGWQYAMDLTDDLCHDQSKTYRAVAWDTLDAMGGNSLSMAASHLIDTSGSGNRSVEVVAQFGGEGAGWNRLAEMSTRPYLDLVASGYGFWGTCHMNMKKMDSGKRERTFDLFKTVRNFYTNRMNYIGVINRSIQTVSIPAVMEERDIGGKKMMIPKAGTGGTKQQHVYKCEFGALTPNEDNVGNKARLPIRDLVLGLTDGFEQFEAAYKDACAAELARDAAANTTPQGA